MIPPLTEEERKFYENLPSCLGKVRMARLLELVDYLSDKNVELHAEIKRLRQQLPKGWALVEPVEYSRYLAYRREIASVGQTDIIRNDECKNCGTCGCRKEE